MAMPQCRTDMDLLSSIKHAIDPLVLIEQFGYIGLFLIVFAESGLFFGFFLPGDSLLLIAGTLAATGILNLWILIPIIFIAAFLGDQVGYWTGHKVGRRLFKRQDSWLFKKEYVERSEEFFAKHGHKTIIIGRFVPIVRTFTPILAGIGNMPYPTFFTYNLVGAVLWGIGITLIGYGLGNIPGVDRYINIIVLVVIVASIVPALIHLRQAKTAKS